MWEIVRQENLIMVKCVMKIHSRAKPINNHWGMFSTFIWTHKFLSASSLTKLNRMLVSEFTCVLHEFWWVFLHQVRLTKIKTWRHTRKDHGKILYLCLPSGLLMLSICLKTKSFVSFLARIFSDTKWMLWSNIKGYFGFVK